MRRLRPIGHITHKTSFARCVCVSYIQLSQLCTYTCCVALPFRARAIFIELARDSRVRVSKPSTWYSTCWVVCQCLLCILAFFLAYFHAISRHIIFQALVALKLLVSLISRHVACSPRIFADTHTHTQTGTQNNYCNPRCACAPRVNNITASIIIANNYHIVYSCACMCCFSRSWSPCPQTNTCMECGR